MSEPWFSADVFKLILVLLTIAPGTILGMLSGFMDRDIYDRHFNKMIIIAILFSISALVFGVIAKYSNQPSNIIDDYFSGGSLSLVLISGFWFVHNHYFSNND